MSDKHEEHAAAGHGSLTQYLVGFGLAVVLTLVSFGIVAAGLQPKYLAVVGLIVAAVLQIYVHLRYFLHLDGSKGQLWNTASFGFTALIVFLFIAGTVWVIFTLNARLM